MGLKELLGFSSGSGDSARPDPVLPSGSPLADAVREAVQIELAAQEERAVLLVQAQAQIADQQAEARKKLAERQGAKIESLSGELQEAFTKFRIMELMRDLRNNVWKGGDLSPKPIFVQNAYKAHGLSSSENVFETFARLSITYRDVIIDPKGHVSADGGGYSMGEVNHGPGVCLTGLDVGVLAFDENRRLFVRTIGHALGGIYPGNNGRDQISERMLHADSLAKIPLTGEEDSDDIFHQLSGIVGEDAKNRYLRGFLPPGKLVAKGEQAIEEFSRRKREAHDRSRPSFPVSPGFG